MKQLLFFILVFGSLLLQAQARIGFSYTEIKEEFSSSEYLLSTGFEPSFSEAPYISVIFENAIALYVFDKKWRCYATVIAPLGKHAIRKYIRRYNLLYDRINDTTWHYNTDDGTTLEIVLYPSSEVPSFIWSEYGHFNTY